MHTAIIYVDKSSISRGHANISKIKPGQAMTGFITIAIYIVANLSIWLAKLNGLLCIMAQLQHAEKLIHHVYIVAVQLATTASKCDSLQVDQNQTNFINFCQRS